MTRRTEFAGWAALIVVGVGALTLGHQTGAGAPAAPAPVTTAQHGPVCGAPTPNEGTQP